MITNFNQYIKENVSTNQFFKTYEETKKWLNKMRIKNYTINDDLTVDINGHIFLDWKRMKIIPIKFGKVYGHFVCANNELTTLEGSPKIVNRNFYCAGNYLTTLIGSPKEVGGNFYCDKNKLTSLEGLSSKIDEHFSCYNNKLITLEGYNIYHLKKNINYTWYRELNPKIKEDYFDKHLEDNPEIISLINFETSAKFKEKWNHLFNANKFDLI